MRLNGFPKPGPWTHIRAELRPKSRAPIIAVVAYVGADALEMLPLRKGDFLVCDGSDIAIRQALTSAKALSKYAHRGVVVFSHEGLHAKTIASEKFAWVGSANSSSNSRDSLIEASVRVTGRSASQVFKWAGTLATEDVRLSREDLERLVALPVRRRGPGPRARSFSLSMPASLKRVTFIESSGHASKSEMKLLERDEEQAKTTALKIGLTRRVDALVSDDAIGTLDAHDWLIEIRNGHVMRPAVVVRQSVAGAKHLLWFVRQSSSSKPSIGQLRSLVPTLVRDFDEHIVSDPKTLRAVIPLFAG